jgi:hypothetical protein
MPNWGEVEAEEEVASWLEHLTDREFGQAEFYIDLLAAEGVHLDEPYSRQLKGKLRELRFYMGRTRQRITYFIKPGRRIVLLTVFRKSKQKEDHEIARAERAMNKCIAEEH